MPIDPPGPVNRALPVRARDKKISGLPERTEPSVSFLSYDTLEPLPVIDPEPPGDEGGPAAACKLHLSLGLIVDIRA